MRIFDENKPVSDTLLKKGLQDAVEVIERYGEHYWPLFERLENELIARQKKHSRLAKFRRGSKFQ